MQAHTVPSNGHHTLPYAAGTATAPQQLYVHPNLHQTAEEPQQPAALYTQPREQLPRAARPEPSAYLSELHIR